MRSFPLISSTLLGLTLILSASACGDSGSDDTSTAEDTGDGDPGDGDPGDGDPGDGDAPDTSSCFEQPEICAQFVACIGSYLPEQAELVEGQYGEEGSCWCGSTEDDAQECFVMCHEQVEAALADGSPAQTIPQCHDSWCTLDELDPTQPYGPLQGDGTCLPYPGNGGVDIDQFPTMSPAGLPGSYCAPACSGIANACPDHNQTSASGTCALNSPNGLICALDCYVNPTVIGGTQCPCGAICRPQGGPDGDGNVHGLCTFD